jgi:hypothetical protein
VRVLECHPGAPNVRKLRSVHVGLGARRGFAASITVRAWRSSCGVRRRRRRRWRGRRRR